MQSIVMQTTWDEASGGAPKPKNRLVVSLPINSTCFCYELERSIRRTLASISVPGRRSEVAGI